ncbi:hypothetical protein BDR07DRAFT_1492264 [Suillus spraguei]|nr:hypothetical protein BDR07DRAFT_1492264 [Suillus spraguei]
MFSAVPLLTLLALSVTGSPVEVRNSRITLPITRRLKSSNGTNQVQHDEARVAAFRDNSMLGQRANIPLENDIWCSLISVGIGYPPTYYNLVVDTGSALTWVGATKKYEITATSFETPLEVAVEYGIGSLSGRLFTDTLTLGDAFTTTMPIGVVSHYENFNYNGILGIGPGRLSAGDVTSNPEMELETITERLYLTDSISQPFVGMFFQPSSRDEPDGGGILNFGEPDRALYTGNIVYTRVPKIHTSSLYWGIEQRITYGTKEILPTAPGIVDCGCTYNFLAFDAFENYRAATGAEFDATTKLLSITPEQYDALDDLNFHIEDQTYTLTRNAQIWPRHLNSKIDGLDNGIYLAFQSLSTPVGSGKDFRLGYVFLQRFYASYDIVRHRVGFARTRFTDATTN